MKEAMNLTEDLNSEGGRKGMKQGEPIFNWNIHFIDSLLSKFFVYFRQQFLPV